MAFQHVIDALVKELARKVGAQTQVIDTAHIAAGEWGNFQEGMFIVTAPILVQKSTVEASI